MTFRDDHDAALARADALEGELERKQDKLDTSEKEVAELRRQNDELRRKRADDSQIVPAGIIDEGVDRVAPITRSRPVVRVERLPTLEPSPEPKLSIPIIELFLLLVIVGGVVFGIYVALRGHK